jgi:hypothetical protein
MARPLRIEYERALYHITARGNERKNNKELRKQAIYFIKKNTGATNRQIPSKPVPVSS